MNRISRHQMFMRIAEAAAERSTCLRANVGAVIAHENKLLSIGYNGAPPGKPHCTYDTCASQPTCLNTVHAEVNAITRATDLPFFATLYSTVAPCPACALALVKASIGRVFFRSYYRENEGLEVLKEARIPCYRLLPSGLIIIEGDKRVVYEE